MESTGVETDNDFKMKYQIIAAKKRNVDEIVEAMRRADRLYLATDPDREGEAISAHVQELLTRRGVLNGKPVHRIVFHEITSEAINHSLVNPGKLSESLVQAQQSRDALDLLVGFGLSPLLIRKLNSSRLSAGRVQSPALRLIVERQRQINRFEPTEYWTITAHLEKGEKFEATLTKLNNTKLKKFDIGNSAAADEAISAIQSNLRDSDYQLTVTTVEKRIRTRQPLAPFTTSTLVQAASRKLRMSARNTAITAQRLYEGLKINGQQTGLITYTRTDSVTMSGFALNQIRNFIKQTYGEGQLPKSPRQFRTKSKNAQEAHEAIRPTDVFLTPEKVKPSLNDDQFRLYQLIWQRAVATQLKPALYDDVAVDFSVGEQVFHATGSTMKFQGWLAVYQDRVIESSKSEQTKKSLPPLEKGERIAVLDVASNQHFTKPPPRYNQGSLVRKLEEYGIGRPSTWPTIITKLLDRNYVELVNRNFVALSLGCFVVDFLNKHFDRYIDYQFTSHLEDELDEVARGEKRKIDLLTKFWDQFDAQLQEKKSVSRFEVNLGVDPESGRELLVRVRGGGPFLQLGRRDDGHEKPLFRSLPPSQDPDEVTLKQAIELFQSPSLPRSLGKTDQGLDIVVRSGRYGPYFSATNAEGTVEHCSLNKDSDPLRITLEEIQEILSGERLPKELGKTEEDEQITVRSGRFGPYLTVTHPKKRKLSVNLGKLDPLTITLEEALPLIKEKKENPFRRTKQVIKKFDQSGLEVLNGRYGPYVSDGKINATIPKSMEPSELDLETCQRLIEEKRAKGPVKRRKPRRTRKR